MTAGPSYDFSLLPGEPFLFLRARDERMTWALRWLERRMRAEIDMGMREQFWHDQADRWRALREVCEVWRARNPDAVADAAGQVKPCYLAGVRNAAEAELLADAERLGPLPGGFASWTIPPTAHRIEPHPPELRIPGAEWSLEEIAAWAALLRFPAKSQHWPSPRPPRSLCEQLKAIAGACWRKPVQIGAITLVAFRNTLLALALRGCGRFGGFGR